MQPTGVHINRNEKLYGNIQFILHASLAAFITYLSMYAFRKPFTAATYDGLKLWSIDYKILLILSQLLGYTVSKYLGIKYVSELKPQQRTKALIFLMAFAMLMLFLFGLTNYPYNFIFMFFNGLPLGMIWGVVFGYLEGRRNTELFGAVMASSFIISSGLVKGVGKFILDTDAVTENWMPFIAALSFTPLLILGIFLLNKLSPPAEEDRLARTERVPMNATDRKRFTQTFLIGIIFTVLLYVGLTVFRDIRDNFAIDFWQELSLKGIPQLLIFSELPIAIVVLAVIACVILIKNNKWAFYLNIGMILFSGALMLFSTSLYHSGRMGPITWTILSGFSMYLPYIAYHTLFFERWIAFFKYKSNAGFLMYMSDAFGYLGSIIILLVRNFATPSISWVNYFIYSSYILGVAVIILSVFLLFYFKKTEKKLLYNET
jgi:MFS family permease